MKVKSKKIIFLGAIILVVLAVILTWVPAGKSSNVTVIDAESRQFSQQDIAQAVDTVKSAFTDWKGCELVTLRYLGDQDNNSAQFDYLKQQYEIDEHIVFEMTFRTGRWYNPSYESNSNVTVKTILGRKNGESWKYLDSGRP